MVEGNLSNGFEYRIEDENLDNYETFEKLCDIDLNPDENLFLVREVMIDILGKEQYDGLKAYVKEQDGRISTVKMMELLREILSIEEVKNSEPSPA